MAEVSWHAAADAEYHAALGWYLARSVRAAIRFEAAVNRAVSFVSAFPEACPMRDHQHRYCSVRRYPYGLICRVEGDQARVVALAHNRQLPGYWVGRA